VPDRRKTTPEAAGAETGQSGVRADQIWREAAGHADHARVARMLAHVEEQRAQLPASHR